MDILPPWFHPFQRAFPSANMVAIDGARPLLIDTGYGSDAAATEGWLRSVGMPPERLALVANTHYHCDHVGGNAELQERYGLPVAAHAGDAALINRRDHEVGAAVWLDQPIEPYTVTRALHDGDEITTGTTTVRVIATPGHTLGHLAFYLPDEQILICGDAVHGDDVAWLNPFREGVGAIDRALASLDRLAALPVRWALSGHGAPFTDAAGAIARAQARYHAWLAQPAKLAWHACKRIFTYALMIDGGMRAEAIAPYLLRCGWYLDYCRTYFHSDPSAFVQPLLAELLRARAVRWEADTLVAAAPYTPPTPGWCQRSSAPANWPPARP